MNRQSYMTVFAALLFAVFVQASGASELLIGTRVEPLMDPHSLYITANMAYSKHIFGNLTRLDNNMRLAPDLAKSWKAIDSNTWEFKLAKGVKFHDGSNFTAEDAVFSFKRVPNVGNGAFMSGLIGIAETKIADPDCQIRRICRNYCS